MASGHTFTQECIHTSRRCHPNIPVFC